MSEQLLNRRREDNDQHSLNSRLGILEESHDELYNVTLKLAERQTSYENSISTLTKGLSDASHALSELSQQLKGIAPMVQTYSDLQGFGRVIGWIVGNSKQVMIFVAAIAMIAKSDTLMPILLKLL